MKNIVNWNFDNSYSKLSNAFKEHVEPIAVKNPELVLINEDLAEELDLNFSKIDKGELGALFTGNILPKGSNAIAQAYAGHQFGHFTMLGDGRAVLIGEHLTRNNKRYDIQFKGSGKTAFSRNGDGRAALGPMLREYIISEAMHNLNIPSTRSLAVAKTGETIMRDTPLQGAILTRVASSHIRVGTFQYVAARDKKDELEILLNYVIKRHYPELKNSKNKALDLLMVLIDKQIDLVINWMRVGFIHGVMNTDNMTISGETIDYGPCAFMDTYDPKTVFSSIDKMGRYAYCNQPAITKWNLSRFAECLIPLIDEDKDIAIRNATELIETFDKKYEEKWLNMMRNKLGLLGEDNQDKFLIIDLLTWMHQNKVDYTNTFCHLMNLNEYDDDCYENNDFKYWKNKWQDRLTLINDNSERYISLMRNVNPLVIPRNDKVEKALAFAEKGDFIFLRKFISVLKKPYKLSNEKLDYQNPSPQQEKYQTFCGT